jgi:DNA-binding beta-propeller fold protein YncE
MSRVRFLIGAVIVTGVLGTVLPGQQKQARGGQEEFGPYNVVENWQKPLREATPGEFNGLTWGSVGAVFAESADRIWIAQRGMRELPAGSKPWIFGGATEPPISGTAMHRPLHVVYVANRNGEVIQAWRHNDQHFAHKGGRGPHKIKMSPYDKAKHVWVIDDNLHVIYKFTYDGKLVMTLGEVGVPGRGPNNFSRPTDIAWLPDGTFFISDGYVGTRVAKFDPNGKFIKDWGNPTKDPNNPQPNEWRTVHSIAISKDRRIFVSDRNNNRFQVFDEEGKFLDLFPTGTTNSTVYYHLISDDQFIWAGDGGTNRIIKWDLNGNYVYGWGGTGSGPGQFDGPHQLTVDNEGNLYVAEVFNGRVQKFTPKPGADPAKLVRAEARPGW